MSHFSIKTKKRDIVDVFIYIGVIQIKNDFFIALNSNLLRRLRIMTILKGILKFCYYIFAAIYILLGGDLATGLTSILILTFK